MVERQLPKLHTRVRFPSPAPILQKQRVAQNSLSLPITKSRVSYNMSPKGDFFVLCRGEAAMLPGNFRDSGLSFDDIEHYACLSFGRIALDIVALG